MRGFQLGVHHRLALLCAVAVAVAIALASALAWATAARVLTGQVDESLRLPGPVSEDVLIPASDLCAVFDRTPGLALALTDAQVLRPDGTRCGGAQLGQLDPTAQENAAARTGGSLDVLRTARTDTGTVVRARSFSVGDEGVVTIMRDVSDMEATLRRLGAVLALATVVGGLVALLAGWLVARTSLRPLDALTGAAEHIATTEDLDVPIQARGTDEIARLAGAFNRMTAALSRSRGRQRQLVSDASHELRTPLTSLRTNVELLARSEESGRPLPEGERRALLASLVEQADELTHLVRELTVLAHDDAMAPRVDVVPVDLVAVVERAVRRAGRRGDHRITTTVHPWWVVGDPTALERAVVNVLDNAVKFSPAESTVAVMLRGGILDVDDTGPGLPEDERHRAMDRFWRSPSARSLPGSGLGLSIVAEAVQRHGGEVRLSESPAGGTRVRIRLPGQATEPDHPGSTTTVPSARPSRISTSPPTTRP